MVKFLITAILIGSNLQCFAQNKTFNLIITVDNNVNPKISSPKLKIFLKDGNSEEYDLEYYPGNMEIATVDYDHVLSNDNIKAAQLNLNYHEICGDKTKIYNYEIDDFKIDWFKNKYFILHLINTSKKKYRKIYNPLPNKNFTYEYEYPGGATKRVQKKFTKEQKRCSKKKK